MRPLTRRVLAPRPVPAVKPRLTVGLMVGLAVALVVVMGVGTRAGDAQWAWRAGGGARLFDGVPMHWEWIDVADAAWFLENDARWTDRAYDLLSDRLARFVAPLSISVAGAWLGTAWRGAVFLTLVCWLIAAAATYQLTAQLFEHTVRGRRVGGIAALLVSLSPGFTAYVGNIEARPFVYAAVPLALLALARAGELRRAPGPVLPDGDRRSHPLVIAGVIFLANGTMEIGPPLLLLLYLVYVLPAGRAGPGQLARQIRWAGVITLGYALLSVLWLALARVAALGRVGVSEDNDAWHKLVKTIVAGDLTVGDFTARLWNIEVNAFPAFTDPVLLLLLPGLLLLPRRVAGWAIAWIGTVVAAIVFTRYYPRTIYFAYPAVYIAAAAAVEAVGRALAGRLAPGGAARAVVSVVPAAVLMVMVGARVFADLSGDLSLARLWWPGH